MKVLLKSLGENYGYGTLFEVAQTAWAESLKEKGYPEDHVSAIGPYLKNIVSCVCQDYKAAGLGSRKGKNVSEKQLKRLTEKNADENGHCDLCCGLGWLTKRVKRMVFYGVGKEI